MKSENLYELNVRNMESNQYPISSSADSDSRYMTLALAEAKKAFAMGEVPVGCVIVADGQVVGRGHNLTETLADVTAHAEMQAITAAANTLGGKYLSQCTLYSFLVNTVTYIIHGLYLILSEKLNMTLTGQIQAETDL